MHIAIAGKLGSGKSTYCKILNERYGFEVYSTGAVQRKVALEMGISTLELNRRLLEDPELDFVIDDAVAKLSRERVGETIIFDSRMAWHFAENSYKIFITVDPLVAAKRVMAAKRGNEESYLDVIDARDKLIERSIVENTRFREIYNINNLDYHNYNLIIDTSFTPPEIICDVIYNCFNEYISSPRPGTRLMLPPRAVYPTMPLGYSDNSDTVEISFYKNYHYLVKGHEQLRLALENNNNYIGAVLSDSDVIILNDYELKAYEEKYGFKYPER